LVRERSHFWSSRPSGWLLLSSALDILLVSVVAEHGILMTALPLKLIVIVFGASALALAALDFAKIAVLRQFR
jgi:H+-transporting ATPase